MRLIFVPILMSLMSQADMLNDIEKLESKIIQKINCKSRIKDIARFEISRENLLIGYGLVVGLQGSGDSLKTIPFTSELLTNMLERLGVNVRDKIKELNTKNIAAVVVTALLPSFAIQGSKIDINVAAVGDCKSLKGGTLLVTPLRAADDEVYAVAQGPVYAFGMNIKTNNASVQEGNPTNGTITNGAIVEKELKLDLKDQKILRLSLNKQDFTTATNVAAAINLVFPHSAKIVNSSTIEIKIPEIESKNIVKFISKVEQIEVSTDNRALILMDSNNGVITFTKNVGIKPCVISQGELTISISNQPKVEKDIFGVPHLVPSSSIQIGNSGKNVALLEETTTLEELRDLLSRLNLNTKTIMQIIQNLHAAGAIDSDLIIR